MCLIVFVYGCLMLSYIFYFVGVLKKVVDGQRRIRYGGDQLGFNFYDYNNEWLFRYFGQFGFLYFNLRVDRF